MTLGIAGVCVFVGYLIGYLLGWMRGVESTRTYVADVHDTRKWRRVDFDPPPGEDLQ